MSQWEQHGLPQDLSSLTFLDVGCWEGDMCAEATKRNAAVVLGVDCCTSPDLVRNMERFGFGFIQLDVLSEKVLELPEFDIVLCAGVLYHVENPLSLLFRLRKLCRLGGWLYLETTVYHSTTAEPVMVFHPGDSLDGNVSNWWSPNEACLQEMLSAAGFSEFEAVLTQPPAKDASAPAMGRIGIKIRATLTPHAIPLKLLPRRPSYMPQSMGLGNRHGVKR